MDSNASIEFGRKSSKNLTLHFEQHIEEEKVSPLKKTNKEIHKNTVIYSLNSFYLKFNAFKYLDNDKTIFWVIVHFVYN